MQKVISINLNGNAYQVEETGYAALSAYLESADRQLKDNPDRAEIIADLEQAIAEKCIRFLGPHKTVVTSNEVDQIIKEMGPVDGADEKRGSGASGAEGAKGASGRGPTKRLYQMREGAMLAGVCTGIAAYLNIDVTIVRIIFIVLTVLTKGGWILVYVVLAVVIPVAGTSEERAAAHGQLFTAQELIDRAKQNYAGFKGRRDLRRHWREEHRQWKQQWRQAMGDRWGASGVPPRPAGYAGQLVAGILVPLLSIASAAFFWIWVYAIVSLVTRHEVFGFPLPDDVPLLGGVLVLVIAYQAIAWPLHAARRTSYYALGGPHYGAIAAWDGLMSLGFGVLIIWIGFHYMPEVRGFIQALPEVVRSMRPQ
jgi:phage shock protein PspC (stress-responsive transcriptional regulator)